MVARTRNKVQRKGSTYHNFPICTYSDLAIKVFDIFFLQHSNVPSTTKSTTSNNKKLPTPALVSETTTIPKEIIASKSSIPRIPRVEDISSFFDKQRESMETTGSFRSGFGLGFRGTIPKLPAFKKKPGSER